MESDGFIFELLLIGVLILLNGFFAGAEIAVVTARGGRIKTLVESGDRRALALIELKGDPDRFLATVQIGVTVVGTLASAVGGVAAVERLEPVFAGIRHPWAQAAAQPLAVGAVVFTIAYLSLVVGELVPKSLAVRHAETLALWVARPILWLARTSRPVVAALTASTGLVLRSLGRRGEAASPFHTLEDILHIVEEAREQGLIKGHVVEGAFAFQDVEAREVMTPRPHVVGVPRGASLREALKIAAESRYSRFPVYEGDLDDVVGMLYARDLYEAQHLGVVHDVSSLVRPALVIPGTRNAADLMADMRHSQRHLAVVVDEHGGAEGVVTLEDLLESIVGDIRDERDATEREVMALPQGALDADGMVSVRSLNTEHELDLPESPAYVTLAGLILERLGRLPREGEVVELPPVQLTVTALEGRRVARVRIERRGSSHPPERTATRTDESD
jgi:putative hemolysin